MTAIPYILLAALIMVESGGDDRARGKEGELGCLQISPILLRDIERITGVKISPDELFSRKTSSEIAITYLSYYATEQRLGRPPTLRDYALIWRYGPNGWKREDPDPYWEKVKKFLP